MYDSRNIHGAFTEPSLITPIGKGREGKGREIGHLALFTTDGDERQCGAKP